MNDAATGQVNTGAAEVYEEFFVPALFQQWPEHVADAARVENGHRVADVACGTGVLARTLAGRVGPRGSVVGIDINEGMLSVARSKAPQIEWRQARAEGLPFDSDSFDAVASQFGLMFFADRGAAIREMMRVLRPDGRLVVTVWDRLENSPGYAAVAELLQRLFGDDAADAMRAPFVLGEEQTLRSEFTGAGVADIEIATRQGTARFPSIEDWVFTDVKGWTLADMIDDAQFERLFAEARNVLQRFVGSGGTVTFEAPAHLVTAVKS